MTSSNNEYEPDLVSAPGETLAELAESRGISTADLALRLALSKELVKAILEGAAPITSDLSAMLEKLFDVPARFWNNRERRYREHLAQQNSAIPPQPRLRGASGA